MDNKAEQERKKLNSKLMKRTFVSQMKNTFSVSLCKNGILGGWIVIEEESMVTYPIIVFIILANVLTEVQLRKR